MAVALHTVDAHTMPNYLDVPLQLTVFTVCRNYLWINCADLRLLCIMWVFSRLFCCRRLGCNKPPRQLHPGARANTTQLTGLTLLTDPPAAGVWVAASLIGSTHPGAAAQPNVVVAQPADKLCAWQTPVRRLCWIHQPALV